MRNNVLAALVLGVCFVIGLTVLAVTWRGRASTQVSDYGINDNSSIEKQITAVVHASFAIR